MKIEEILEKAGTFADMMLKKHGRMEALVSIHGKEGGVCPLPFDGSDIGRWAAVETIKVIRAKGMLDFALLISEAWMAKAPKNFKPGDAHPPVSEMPDKQEVIAVRAVMDCGRTATAFWTIKRDAAGKPSLGERLHRGDEFTTKSWLDEAVK